MKDAAEGKLVAPETLWGPTPESLAWTTQPNDLGLGPIVPPATAPDIPTPNAAVCDAWDGRPQPMQCQANGHPSGLGWGRRHDVAMWAIERSRCGKPPAAQSTLFVIPSFDTLRNNHEVRLGACHDVLTFAGSTS